MQRSKYLFKPHNNYPFNSIDVKIKPIRNSLPFLKPQLPTIECIQSLKFEEMSFSKDQLKLPSQPDNFVKIIETDPKFGVLSEMMLKLVSEVQIQKKQLQIFTHKVTTNFYVYVDQLDNGYTIISNCCKQHAFFMFIMMSKKFYLFCSKCNRELYSERPVSRAKTQFVINRRPQHSIVNSKVSTLIQSGRFKTQKLQSLYYDDDNDNDDLKSIIDKLY